VKKREYNKNIKFWLDKDRQISSYK